MLIVVAIAAAGAVAAQPISNPANWIRPSDYPVSAEMWAADGVVEVNLSVNALGQVSGCRVIASSGNADLDTASCTILKERARFRPARSQSGKPTTGEFSQRIQWNYPVDEYAASNVRTAYLIAAGGKLTRCSRLAYGPEADGWGCDSELAEKIAPWALGKPLSAYKRVAIDLRIRTNADAGKDYASFGTEHKTAISVRLTIAPDGSVSNCEGAPIIIGVQSFDLCKRRNRFSPDAGKQHRTMAVSMEVHAEPK